MVAVAHEQHGADGREGGIEAVVAIEHDHEGGAAGGVEGRPQQGPEQPKDGARYQDEKGGCGLQAAVPPSTPIEAWIWMGFARILQDDPPE